MKKKENHTSHCLSAPFIQNVVQITKNDVLFVYKYKNSGNSLWQDFQGTSWGYASCGAEKAHVFSLFDKKKVGTSFRFWKIEKDEKEV